jgi:hypothetical protein
LIPSSSIAVGSLFTSSTSLTPFFTGAFLSSFFGAFPPFFYLSSTTSSSPLNILIVSEINLSNLGKALGSSGFSRGGSYSRLAISLFASIGNSVNSLPSIIQ